MAIASIRSKLGARGAGRDALFSVSSRLFGLPITAAATIVTTAVVIGYAGASAYGYIALVGMLFQLVPFADLGLGAAITNAVARRSLTEDGEANAVHVARAAFRLLWLSAAAVMAAVVLLGVFGLWAPALGLPAAYANYAQWAIAVDLLPFAISLPLGIGQRILLGSGKNHVVNMVSVLGPVCATLATVVLVLFRVPPLLLAVATPLGVAVVSGFCFAIALKVSGWNIETLISASRATGTRVRLWNSALPMLLVAVTVPLAMQSDRLVLSHLTDGTALAQYSMAAQLYAPVYSLLATAGMSLWPNFAMAGIRARALWRRALAALAIGGAIAGVGFTLLIGPIGRLVSHGQIEVGTPLAVAFGVLVVVMAIHQPSAMLLTTPRMLAFQAGCGITMLVANVGLSLLLTQLWGVSGVVWGSVIAVLLAQLVPCVWRANRYLNEAMTVVSMANAEAAVDE